VTCFVGSVFSICSIQERMMFQWDFHCYRRPVVGDSMY